MARKNIFFGVSENKSPIANAPAVAGAGLPNFAGLGAPGNLSRSINNLAAKADAAKELEAKLIAGQMVVELDTKLIDPSFVGDRMMEAKDEAFETLKTAIARDGQNSPILVRPHPAVPGRYQAAFGHRRLRVAQALGRMVRAVIKTLSDQELVVAQGQENSVRADLSFIERARFAEKLLALNYGRDVVMSALAADKTTVSRMLLVTSRIPAKVIDAIGPAAGIGRPRWVDLAGCFEANPAPSGVDVILRSEAFCNATSDDRFEQIAALCRDGGTLSGGEPDKKRGSGGEDVQCWAPENGNTLVTLKHQARSCVIKMDEQQAPGFGEYVLRQMDRLYGEYLIDQPAERGSLERAKTGSRRG